MMEFIISGSKKEMNVWVNAIKDAIKFREQDNSFFAIHCDAIIAREIEKVILDFGCEDYFAVYDGREFDADLAGMALFSIDQERSFYDFCVKCKFQPSFFEIMKLENLRYSPDPAEGIFFKIDLKFFLALILSAVISIVAIISMV